MNQFGSSARPSSEIGTVMPSAFRGTLILFYPGLVPDCRLGHTVRDEAQGNRAVRALFAGVPTALSARLCGVPVAKATVARNHGI